MKSSRRPVLAFTLVELLFVVAIIALLAALALPAIGGAIKRSNAAKCASNLRQIGVAYRTAIIDNNGRLFGTFETNASGGNKVWQTSIQERVNWPGSYHTNAVFRCPSDPRGLSYAAAGNGFRSYGQNIALCGNVAQGMGPMAAIIPEQTKTFLVMEVVKGYGAHPSWGGNYNPTNMHGTNCNVLFVDGHVEALTAATITNAISTLNSDTERTTNAYRWK